MMSITKNEKSFILENKIFQLKEEFRIQLKTRLPITLSMNDKNNNGFIRRTAPHSH